MRISKGGNGKELSTLALSFLRLRMLQNIHQGRLFVKLFSMVLNGNHFACGWKTKFNGRLIRNSLLMFADNRTYTHHLASLQLAFVRILEQHLEAFKALHSLIATICAAYRHSDIGQLRTCLQIWPRCKQTSPSLGHLLPLERRFAKEMAIPGGIRPKVPN